jgi:hypothetical protein
VWLKTPLAVIAGSTSTPARNLVPLDLLHLLRHVGGGMRHGRPFPLLGFLHRTVAAGCAALVFALGLCAVSPVLHQQLHLDDHSSDDRCAVVLFASGVSLALAAVTPTPSVSDWQEKTPRRSDEIFLDSPRYLLQPERGPPVA